MIKVTALTDAFSVIDEQGTHTWTIGKAYKINVHAHDMDITSDIGIMNVLLSDYWYGYVNELFGVARSLIELYAEQQRRK